MDLGRFETGLDVKDIGASLAFYRALGFRHVDGGVEIGSVGLRKGDCRLTLFQGHLQPPRTQLIFWQGDIAAIARDLIGKGLRFEDGHPRSDDRGNASAMIMDPDGHPLFFINMPIDYVDHPAHARPTPPYRPRRRLTPDRTFGWFELSLAVSNVKRSCDFYRKLGFRLAQAGTDWPGVTLQNNDCRIALFQDVLDASPAQLVFRQGDFEAVARRLARSELSFEKGPAAGGHGGAVALLRDPDGHAIHFYRRAGPGSPRAGLARPP
jgi:catechol 2,3-dioxygenase-like lactoylglutathione lyase family enzyme